MMIVLGLMAGAVSMLGVGFWWMRLRPQSPYAIAQPENRRRHERKPLDVDVEIAVPGLSTLAGRTRDLSTGGVFACLPTAEQTFPAAGTDLPLALLLPARGGPLRLELRGRIVRHEATGVALEFTGMSRESYENLQYLIHHNAMLQREAQCA